MGGGVEQLERDRDRKGGRDKAGTSPDTDMVSQLQSNVNSRIPSM